MKLSISKTGLGSFYDVTTNHSRTFEPNPSEAVLFGSQLSHILMDQNRGGKIQAQFQISVDGLTLPQKRNSLRNLKSRLKEKPNNTNGANHKILFQGRFISSERG